MAVNEAVVAVGVAAYAGVGLLILWHLPGHPIGRLMLGASVVWGLGEGLLGVAVHRLLEDADQPLWALAATIGSTARGLGALVLVLWLPFRFPDGTPVSRTRRDRSPEVLALLTLAVFGTVSLLSPDQTDLRIDHVDNPVGLPTSLSPLTDALAALSLVLGIVVIVLAVLSLTRRWRSGSALGRQRVLWFALAFAAPVSVLVLSFVDAADAWMFGVALVPVPVAVSVAVFQRRLYDVQLAVNRSLAYGSLSLVIALLYAVTVGGVGAVLDSRGAAWLAWVAAAVVAVSFAPLRDALQQAANRLTYGQWSDPHEVLAGVGQRLADVGDVPALLDTLAAELAAGLGLEAVRVSRLDGAVLAATGSGPVDEEIPLLAFGQQVGVLAWRAGGLREADARLLTDVANQLGAVLHSSSLLVELRASQERLVLSREEERKRLRRDLHDGLGPTLAALTLQVDTVRNRWPEASPDLLAVRETVQAAVADVRRVVEGLRPPALDELGLSEALQQLGRRLDAGGGTHIRVESDDLPAVPAAVEVAAYRIVQEALTNAVRHAGGTCCTVRVSTSERALDIQVQDDGAGTVRARPGGLGLSTMQERAEEIGGTVRVETVEGVGTAVRVRLPISGGAGG